MGLSLPAFLLVFALPACSRSSRQQAGVFFVLSEWSVYALRLKVTRLCQEAPQNRNSLSFGGALNSNNISSGRPRVRLETRPQSTRNTASFASVLLPLSTFSVLISAFSCRLRRTSRSGVCPWPCAPDPWEHSAA